MRLAPEPQGRKHTLRWIPACLGLAILPVLSGAFLLQTNAPAPVVAVSAHEAVYPPPPPPPPPPAEEEEPEPPKLPEIVDLDRLPERVLEWTPPSLTALEGISATASIDFADRADYNLATQLALSQKPYAILQVDPIFRKFKLTKTEGVYMRVTIEANGNVSDVDILKATHEDIIEDVERAMYRWKFEPALTLDGTPVRKRVAILLQINPK